MIVLAAIILDRFFLATWEPLAVVFRLGPCEDLIRSPHLLSKMNIYPQKKHSKRGQRKIAFAHPVKKTVYNHDKQNITKGFKNYLHLEEDKSAANLNDFYFVLYFWHQINYKDWVGFMCVKRALEIGRLWLQKP